MKFILLVFDSGEDDLMEFLKDIFVFKNCQDQTFCKTIRKEYSVAHYDNHKYPPSRIQLFNEFPDDGQEYLKELPLMVEIAKETYAMFVDGYYSSFRYEKDLKGTFEKLNNDKWQILNFDLTIKVFIKFILDCSDGLWILCLFFFF